MTRCNRERDVELFLWEDVAEGIGGTTEEYADRIVEGVATSVAAASVARVENTADIGVAVGAFDTLDRIVFTEERGVSLSEISLDRCSAISLVCRAVVGVVTPE